MRPMALTLVCGVFGLWGCRSPSGPDGSTPDASTPCMSAGCGTRSCGVDGCGNSCGACDAGTTCNQTSGACEAGCAAETREAFCARMASGGKRCGTVRGTDTCGQARTEGCATCPAGQLCTADNTCVSGCTPETTAQFCTRMELLGKVCGQATDVEPCTGLARTESCGGCATGRSCTATNTCASTCTPESLQSFCARQGATCGVVTANDNCGVQRQYLCGTCTSGTCMGNSCCSYESPAQFCGRLATQGKTCGVVTAPSCGVSRQEDCGAARCGQDEACNYPANTCFSCVTESALDFCARMANLGMECGPITGVDSCTQLSRTVDCGSSACATGSACMSNRCSAAGGSCASPATLVADTANPDHFVVSGNTANGVAAMNGTCAGGSPGAELVYAVTLGGVTNRSVVATLRAPAGSALGPTLYARTTCTATAGEVCRAGTSLASVRLNNISPGPRYFVVDSSAVAAQGPFTLDVLFGAVDPVPANDTCAAAIDLGAPGSAGWILDGTSEVRSIAGTTVGANDDTAGSCGASGPGLQNGGDVMYQFRIPTGATRSAVISVNSSAADYLPAVYLRRLCADATAPNQVGCGTTTQPAEARISASELVAGTYSVHVDGVSGTAGGFVLQIALTP